MKKGLLLCIFLAIGFFGWFKNFSLYNFWRPYSPTKIIKEPRQFLVDAMKYLHEIPASEKRALDLGAGAGHDTAYLLKNGWQVWAIDEEKESTDFLQKREDIVPYTKSLKVMNTAFIDLPWDTFSQLRFYLMYAAFSLPFMTRHNFFIVLPKIVDSLSPGGFFIGTFFGSDHQAFHWWVNMRMTFLTRQECLDLFNTLKIHVFEEYHQKNDRGYYEHFFTVVAFKPFGLK